MCDINCLLTVTIRKFSLVTKRKVWFSYLKSKKVRQEILSNFLSCHYWGHTGVVSRKHMLTYVSEHKIHFDQPNTHLQCILLTAAEDQ